MAPPSAVFQGGWRFAASASRMAFASRALMSPASRPRSASSAIG